MELSILIPSRNESLLQRTIDDIVEHAEAETEIIVGLDGWRPEDWGEYIGSKQFPIKYIHLNESIGQRAMTNRLCEKARGTYVMKSDAHCSYSQGFDRKMLALMDDKTVLAPLLMPMDGRTWAINGKKQSAQFVFNSNFVVEYIEGKPAGETMCLQGAAWMISRKNYWDWNICDETLSSWGAQAAEIGIRTFLNGGVCKTTSDAYYGHVFRESPSDFPYDRGENPGKFATEELIRRYRDKRLLPLIERFGYPADWKEGVDKLA